METLPESKGHATPGGLSSSLNYAPENLRHIHLIGICGTGMASLAGMLKTKGYEVTGSDKNIYPPMSDLLHSLEIPVLEGYLPGHLHPAPDLVIVGNVVTRENPEAMELGHLRLPYLSFPQAIGRFALRDKRSIVISGTHGKTTTASMAAWTLETAGMDPGFMIGGIPLNFKKNFKSGIGRYFVIEGDEYDTAFFDKGPKFLHYEPWATILTGIEFDHADIYRDLDHVVQSFRKLIGIIPPEGVLIANGDDKTTASEIKMARCRVETYGLSSKNRWRPVDLVVDEKSTRVTIMKGGRKHLTLETPVYGRHNICNLLSTTVLAHVLGIPPDRLVESAKTFRGVKRRQEIVGEKNGILILDDFAHHPTAVKETIQAVREKYKDRRLMAVFEPRSNSSRRNIFQEAYARSFDMAHIIMIPEPPLMGNIPETERFSSRRLVSDLQERKLKAFYFENTDRLLEAIADTAKRGDILLIMSNGGFDNIHQRLLKMI